jgi:hypothetical protein
VDYICALAIVATFIVTIVLNRTTDDLALIAVASLMTLSAAVAVRNLPLALITIAPPFTHRLALTFQTRTAANAIAQTAVARPQRREWWIKTRAAMHGRDRSAGGERHVFQVLAHWWTLPVGAVRFMKSHGLHGNVLATFDWGEYLIWHLEPGSKIFVDGRYGTVYPARGGQRSFENHSVSETAQSWTEEALCPVESRWRVFDPGGTGIIGMPSV